MRMILISLGITIAGIISVVSMAGIGIGLIAIYDRHTEAMRWVIGFLLLWLMVYIIMVTL